MEVRKLLESSAKKYNFSTTWTVGETSDKISGLPDTILHNILSLLPTKYAIQTSILSKRWRYLWASIHCLDFDHKLFYSSVYIPLGYDAFPFLPVPETKHTNASFIEYVDTVFMLCDTSKIQRFCLSCFYYSYKSRVDTWIRVAIMCNVRELDFSIQEPYDPYVEPYDPHVDFAGISLEEPVRFPHTLFTCESLEVLKMNLKWSIIKMPTTMGFHGLKTLHLVEVAFSDDNSTKKLISSCPILEILSMEKCTLYKHQNLFVSAHKLRSLTISGCVGLKECKIMISTPILLSFKYMQTSMAQDYSLDYSSSILNVDIDFDGPDYPWWRDDDFRSDVVIDSWLSFV
ncbi:FBD-associated F-box protein At5g56370-like [Tasmannia lanceolata]|uniref:FBD-associated F-box protein At5g56370-like n=1 Tax=Tasmannia lanceolata TaxID=3420 RepID=UPI00406496B4